MNAYPSDSHGKPLSTQPRNHSSSTHRPGNTSQSRVGPGFSQKRFARKHSAAGYADIKPTSTVCSTMVSHTGTRP